MNGKLRLHIMHPTGLIVSRSCALHGRILSLKQDSTHLHYRTIWPKVKSDPGLLSGEIQEDTESLIRHYFNLEPNLTELYEQWSKADPNFKKRAPKFTGVRILKQDPWEALIGFICSSNNNISRISQMVGTLFFLLVSTRTNKTPSLGQQLVPSLRTTH
jgi:N-glycosylase/DNA lyase